MEFGSLTEKPKLDEGYELKLLASTLAHEIRNPLQAIRLQLDLARRGASVETIVKEIMTSLERVEAVVDRVQRLSQRYELHPEKVSLAELINSSLSSVRFWLSAAGIQVVEKIEWEGEPVCAGDRDLLEQVLLNLVMNSIQAMPTGGKLTIRVTELIDFASIEIIDTGVGIPDDVKNLVGTPFFTTKDEGTGLGVSFCRTIAALHGGSLEIESKQGEGTLVRLKILKNSQVKGERS